MHLYILLVLVLCLAFLTIIYIRIAEHIAYLHYLHLGFRSCPLSQKIMIITVTSYIRYLTINQLIYSIDSLPPSDSKIKSSPTPPSTPPKQ